jgi:hypothetical protein
LALIKLAQLVPFITRVLLDIDTTLYIPRRRKRVASVPLAWLLAAIIWFSASGLTCWKRYVALMLPLYLSRWRLSYSRWSFWRTELSALVECVAERLCIKAAFRGLALVDSTTLPVCSVQRERDLKCFKGEASKSCGSLGWFVGFKLHIIVSDTGELLRFWLSTGKTHDTAPLLQPTFLCGLLGCLVGDSGYRVGKNRVVANEPGLVVIARPVGVNNNNLPWPLRKVFQARWRVESTFAELKENLGLRVSRRCKSLATLKTVVHSSLITYTLQRRIFGA